MLLIVAGCSVRGYEGPQRAAVSGNVSFEGKPIEKGTIHLKPAGNGAAVISTAPITNGRYSISEERGPTFGSYHVSIFGFEAIESPNADEQDADSSDKSRQYIPTKFNKESSLSIEIDAVNVNADYVLIY